MDAKQFADEIVDPTIAEFENDRRSRRRAFLACVATFHLIDYIGSKRGRQQRLENFRRECPAFDAVDRYAQTFKHGETGNPELGKSRRKHLKAGQIIERPPGRVGEMEAGVSRLGDTTGGVTVGGEGVPDLVDDVKKAAAFLRSKLPP